MGAFFVSLWQWLGSGILVGAGWLVKEWWSKKKERDKLEHEVRFKKLFDKVSDNLIELSHKLTKLKRNFKRFYEDLEWSNAPDKQEQGNEANASFDDSYNFLHENRLLIPIAIFTEVSEYLEAVKAVRLNFNSDKRKEQHGSQKEKYEDYMEKAQADLKEVEPKYERIHETMQGFLGLARSKV